MALPVNGSTHLIPALLLIYRPRRVAKSTMTETVPSSGRDGPILYYSYSAFVALANLRYINALNNNNNNNTLSTTGCSTGCTTDCKVYADFDTYAGVGRYSPSRS